MSSGGDMEVPQWKKDLIARLRNQNKRTVMAYGNGRQQEQQQQLCTSPPRSSVAVGCAADQQPNPSESTPTDSVAVAPIRILDRAPEKCKKTVEKSEKMVQERSWNWDALEAVSGPYRNGDCGKNSDSDSSEDLHYGPGIVSRLKNKYLSLALRESNRASILPMRKAASLENILDDDVPTNGTVPGGNRLFAKLNGSNDTKNVPNRYRNATRGTEMKRARSVETISRSDRDNILDAKPKRESLHEEMLIADKEGSDKVCKVDNKMLETTTESKPYISHRINRPKRITPIMNEKEKPPADFVKHAKMIFERRPEQRTKPPQQTGEVAAKVATYKNIIVQAKTKKPPIKVKPVSLNDAKPKTNGVRTKPKVVEKDEETPENNDRNAKSLPSPIPDISRVEFPPFENESKNTSLSETPDLILTSSPILAVTSPTFRISATENFIKEEIRNSIQPQNNRTNSISSKLKTNLEESSISSKLKTNLEESPFQTEDATITQTLVPEVPFKSKTIPSPSLQDEPDLKSGSPQSLTNTDNASNTITFNFVKLQKPPVLCSPINKNVSETRTPPSQPLKLEINLVDTSETKKSPINEIIVSPTKAKPILSIHEIEKNLKNTAKNLQQPKTSAIVKKTEEVNKVPKVKRSSREPETNSIVYKFTDREDVPDYVHNDGSTRVAKIERPKVGEGGIILLPGASIDESFTDEDDEIMRSLEAPPSPCDVTFINDNVLIDGKSSLSQKSKKSKMKISFVEAHPQVFEYPSESSLLVEDPQHSPVNAQTGHSVPSLTGSSSLANYTPKSTEEFQPGVTRSIQHVPAIQDSITDSLQEVEQPILFSAGTNSDILF